MILLVTLVVLVILSTLGYTLCVQVAARRHRDQYIIDYCVARNACTSGLKYALASIGTLQVQLISRPNEPDFSDVFALPESEYQKILQQIAAQRAADGNLVPEDLTPGAVDRDSLKKAAPQSGEKKAPGKKTKAKATKKGLGKKAASDLSKNSSQPGEVNEVGDVNDSAPTWGTPAGTTSVQIRGPYGLPWPLVTEPMKFEIGTAKVTIEVEDENAKYPLGWAMLADEKRRPVAVVGWTTFCEWMGYTPGEISQMNDDLAKIAKTKPFKTEFKQETENVEPPASARSKITRPTSGASSMVVRRTVSKKPLTVEEQIDRQDKEYAKLLHSSLINRDLLSRPSVASDTRKECALKYLGLWATRRVNINSAPRQVLEAALTFGSAADAPKIAQEIIQLRRKTPVADVNGLKQSLPRYAGALDDCRTFITAQSTVYTIRVTAVSGVARVTALAAVSKEGDKVQPIAIISD